MWLHQPPGRPRKSRRDRVLVRRREEQKGGETGRAAAWLGGRCFPRTAIYLGEVRLRFRKLGSRVLCLECGLSDLERGHRLTTRLFANSPRGAWSSLSGFLPPDGFVPCRLGPLAHHVVSEDM